MNARASPGVAYGRGLPSVDGYLAALEMTAD